MQAIWNYIRENPSLILVVSVIVLFVLLCLLVEFVKKKSKMLDSVLELNSNYVAKFNMTIKGVYTYTCHKKSKSAFDRTNFRQLLLVYLSAKGQEIRAATIAAEQNLTLFADYSTKYQEILRNHSVFRLYILRFIEQKVCNKVALKPVTNVSLRIVSTYTSPKGRNHYSNELTFTSSDILQGLQQLSRQNDIKQSKEYQRKIMTDSLRYDIMKRDGFRCKLCGASASDGLKLHVDHIIPVSKGGKTESHNLRTLCEQCNLGKGSKYDSAGLN